MIEIYSDLHALAKAAADRFVALTGEAMRARGLFTAALSGGSTPRPMYELLATPAYAVQVDWSRVHVFWGDERCVSPDDPQSNYRLAKETLLSKVPIPDGNIHRMRGELPPTEAADDYEQQLRDFFGPDHPPRFDLNLLGMGENGHTASLFPHTHALQETSRWVVANYVSELDAWRLTLTAPVINLSETVVFLVSGEKKAQTLWQVLRGPHDAAALPAQMVRPATGNLIWMVDSPAAFMLQQAA